MAKFITLKIKESVPQIQRKIMEALARRFINGHVMEGASLRAGIKIKNLFRRKMYESVTYRELSTKGRLVGELGLESPKSKIDAIIEKWVQSLKVTLRPTKSGGFGIKGGFKIQMVRANYAEVLKMPESKQRATSKRKTIKEWKLMHWLEWLLIRGDERIIIGYDVLFKAGTGRTGLAIMIQPKNKSSRDRSGYVRGNTSRAWSVPPEFTGTRDNNFVTEVLMKMEGDIIRIIKDEIARAARRI